jgi:hypothetical protein
MGPIRSRGMATDQHFHLTFRGTPCPRVRFTPERTWERYAPRSATLGIAPCSSPLSAVRGDHSGGACLLHGSLGRVLTPA